MGIMNHNEKPDRQFNKRNQMGREYWITLRLDEWQAVGLTMKEMREKMDISIRDMAKSLGVSVPRLNRFEKGEPVKDAKLLYNAYLLKISTENLYRNYSNYYNHTQGINQFHATLETILQVEQEAEGLSCST